MTRTLKANRYAKDVDPRFTEFLTGTLPFLSFNEAMAFYSEYLPRLTPSELALLGCNDRFFLLTGLCNRPDAIHPWVYDRAREVEADPYGYLDLWARGHYKDLAQDTPVLTPSGWRLHGDLTTGDWVFGQSGQPTRVVASRKFYDSKCYRITFCNGIEVTAGAGHLWSVNTLTRKRVPGTFVAGQSHGRRIGREPRLVTTEQLAGLVAAGQYRPSINMAAPVQMPEAALPIEPYLLGAWLGDGYSAHGAICGIDAGVFSEIEARGTTLRPPRKREPERHRDYRVQTVTGLTKKLRALDLLHNKHIPECYFAGSVEQRAALLQGLVDTDGSVSDINDCVTVASASHAFARQVRSLAISLGFKARLTPVRATKSWHVTFVAYGDDDILPCRLARKVERLRPGAAKRQTTKQSNRWYVSRIERQHTVPTNCIQVEAGDGMYLAGSELIPTHNSTLTTFAGTIQDILIDPETTIGIFSNTKDIAKPFLSQIKEELERNEDLIRLYPDVLYANPRKESPKWSVDEGIIVKRVGNPKECTVEAHGLIDAMPTGRHFRKLKYDDVITEKNVTNPDQIRKTTERVELSDNLGSGPGTTKEFVGTRYSFADSYGHMIEHGIVKPRIYPATEDGTLEGQPVLLTPEAWEEKKRSQRSSIAAQMLQNPLAGHENTFRTRWLSPYWVRPALMNVYIMADPSKGRSRSSDRTAMAVVGIDSAGNKYLLDGVCHRMSLSDRWETLKKLRLKWLDHPGVQNVKVGYERYGMQSDDEYFAEKMRLEGASWDLIELNWTGEVGRQSKTHRVERLEPDFRHGAFFVPAKVYHPAVEGHVAVWSIEDGADEIVYEPVRGLHQIERRVKAQGEHHRLLQPIRRKDEDGKLYDLTRVLFEEYRFFPFSPRDDFIDAVSRIYDMEPMPAIIYETLRVEDYPDA